MATPFEPSKVGVLTVWLVEHPADSALESVASKYAVIWLMDFSGNNPVTSRPLKVKPTSDDVLVAVDTLVVVNTDVPATPPPDHVTSKTWWRSALGVVVMNVGQ